MASTPTAPPAKRSCAIAATAGACWSSPTRRARTARSSQFFDRLGVPRAAFDDIVTSGDAARHWLAAHPGKRIYHVGPERDLPLYFGLPVEFAGEEDCDLISCTGLFDDETETPDDYAESFEEWRERGVPMLCVNPDIVVERGDRLIWCAGALAERYRELGGETIIVGKPYAPIYETALDRLAELNGAPFDKSKILAIGDGIDTDVRGAFGQGIDAVFVTGGIHAAVFGARDKPDLAAVALVSRHRRPRRPRPDDAACLKPEAARLDRAPAKRPASASRILTRGTVLHDLAVPRLRR